MRARTAPVATPASVAGHSFDRSHLPLLLTLALGVFAGALDLGVLSPALPAIAHGFGIAPRDVAWTFTLYLFANVVSIPIMTKLSDVIGRRSIYTLCVAIFAAGSVLAIAAPNFAIFLCARGIQAAGAGGIFPVATAAIADRVPLERRGSALGLLGAVWGLAAIVGPNVGGVITHYFSWHWIFIANVPLAIVVIVLAQRYVPSTAARVRGPLDLAGVFVLALGLLGVMVGLTRLDTRAATFGNGATVAALVLAALAFAALVPIERRAAAPVIAPQLFATRQLIVTYGLEVSIGLLEGALFFIPAALVAADRLTPVAAGGIAAIGAFMFVAVIPLAGRALDAFGSRAVSARRRDAHRARPRHLCSVAHDALVRDRGHHDRRHRFRRVARRADALHHHERSPVIDARDGRRAAEHLSDYRTNLRRFARRRRGRHAHR